MSKLKNVSKGYLNNLKKKRRLKPVITIITVVKNDNKKITRTIKSILNQNYKNVEYIVIDGGSTDGTLNKINKYRDKIDIIITGKDKNLWDAMNKGIKLSTGNIIGILNSGDYFYKNAFNIVTKYFKDNKIDFLFGSVKKKRVYSGFEPDKIHYRFNIYPAHSCGFFIKRASQFKVGFYDTNFRYGSDYDFFYRMIVKKKLIGLPTQKKEVIGKFDVNGISSKIPFYKSYYYEMIVRYKNKQNFLYLVGLYVIKFINKFINILNIR